MLSAHAPRRFASAKPAPTVRLILARSILVALTFTSVIGAALSVANVTGQIADGMHAGPSPADVRTATADPDADRAAHLIARHDCRVEGYGGQVIPGHAVVTRPGGHPRYVSADAAFRMTFGPDGAMGTGDEAPGHVHAFCL